MKQLPPLASLMKLGVHVNIKPIIFCFLGLFIPSVFAQHNGSQNAEGIYLVESTILSPSGPILKKVWMGINTAQPIRIEYFRIPSGRPIVGRVRILLQPNGCWVVESSNGDAVPLLCLKDRVGRKVVFVTDGGQRWEITAVSVHEVPSEQPGIATEAEPSIDLVINSMD